ncbi:MAG: hypothetical protein LBV34_23560, partial [Nocardiopsaceae bacterium]|nr:hypothetical protein [Nocardiopsaceae bacterium]
MRASAAQAARSRAIARARAAAKARRQAQGCLSGADADVLGSGLAGLDDVRRPVAYTPRRGGGLTGYERVLVRAGFGPV